MSEKIASLELELKSNSEGAVGGLEKLADTLGKIKSATQGGLGLSAVTNELGKLRNASDKLISSHNKLQAVTTKTSNSFAKLGTKIAVSVVAIKKGVSVIGGFIQQSSTYTENMNLFTVAMGQYASEAKVYADNVGELLGIDPGEWARSQGVFMTLATGFGVAGDRASVMSQQLTQLGYDISSFYNISVEDAMTKLQSGLSGELEPLRRLGYDLSQAKLEATALSLGIDKSVSSMTQAEKAELRYHAILNQVTTSHGDMARTIASPANQLRILKAQVEQAGRAIGNIFIPVLTKVLPYLSAFFQVVKSIADLIASLVGFEPVEFDNTGMDGLASGAEEVTEGLDNATDAAKKLKSYTMGFDELNVIDPNSGGSDDESATGGGFGFDLTTYDFLKNLEESPITKITEKMKEWLGITDEIDSWSELLETRFGTIVLDAGLIAGALLGWKFAPAFLKGLSTLTTVLGATLLINSIKCTLTEGLSWKSVIEGAVGGALIGAGIGFKYGGWKGAIGGVVIGIGVSLLINGITSMLDEGVNLENVIATISGVLTTIAGIVAVVKLFNKKNKNSTSTFDTAGQTIGDVQKGTNTLTTKLKTWATNLAWGTLIIAEVVIATAIFVGGVWLIGWELEQVGEAWQPVIDNGATIATAMAIGTAIIGAVGYATATLGTYGKTLCANLGIGIAILAEAGVATALFIGEIWLIGVLLEQVGEAWQPVIDNGDTIKTAIATGTVLLIAIGTVAGLLGVATTATAGVLPIAIALGTAMLVEMGVAALLFIAEIWAIGVALGKVGEAWQPVLDNGETIETGIKTGTKLLIAIGVVTAALGVATVASVGLLPVAIGLGTALLVELSIAFVLFTESLVDVANKLSDELHPALDNVSAILPDLTTNMSSFTSFMKGFAGEVVKYSASSTIAGIAATIDTIIGFFTTDPITKMSNEVTSQNEEFDALITGLKIIIPKIEEATDLVNQYNTAMGSFDEASGANKGLLGNLGIVKSAINCILSGIESLANGVIEGINGMIRALNKLSFTFPDWVPELGGKKFGLNLSTIAKITIPRFAEGGFPEKGQLFIANEGAGAEMVGSIGRRTAVANNDQIVAGITSGVAEANNAQNELLREQNQLLRALLNKDTNITIDGRKVTKQLDRVYRERGATIITGGAY